MAEFGMHEAKTRLSQLVEQARLGDEVVITRNGIPVVRLTPVVPVGGPGARFLAAAGSLSESITIGPDFEFTDDEIEDLFHGPIEP